MISTHKAWSRMDHKWQLPTLPGVVVYAFNLSTQEAVACPSYPWVQGQPGLHQASQNYTVRPCQKNKTKQNKKPFPHYTYLRSFLCRVPLIPISHDETKLRKLHLTTAWHRHVGFLNCWGKVITGLMKPKHNSGCDVPHSASEHELLGAAVSAV